MKSKIFAIYDSKSETFGTPFFSLTVGTALRMYTDLCNDENTQVFRYPADYSLFEIGEYDDAHATIHSHAVKHNLGLGTEFKKTQGVTQVAPLRSSPELQEAGAN